VRGRGRPPYGNSWIRPWLYGLYAGKSIWEFVTVDRKQAYQFGVSTMRFAFTVRLVYVET